MKPALSRSTMSNSGASITDSQKNNDSSRQSVPLNKSNVRNFPSPDVGTTLALAALGPSASAMQLQSLGVGDPPCMGAPSGSNPTLLIAHKV